MNLLLRTAGPYIRVKLGSGGYFCFAPNVRHQIGSMRSFQQIPNRAVVHISAVERAGLSTLNEAPSSATNRGETEARRLQKTLVAR